MICFNEGDTDYYAQLFPDLERMKETLQAIRAGELAKGSHPLHEGLSVNLFSYETASAEERNWEAHESHVDVHVVLSGQELVGFVNPTSLNREAIDVVNDSYEFQAEATNYWQASPDQWLVIYPNEGHKTGIGSEPVTVKKAVFKIKVK